MRTELTGLSWKNVSQVDKNGESYEVYGPEFVGRFSWENLPPEAQAAITLLKIRGVRDRDMQDLGLGSPAVWFDREESWIIPVDKALFRRKK